MFSCAEQAHIQKCKTHAYKTPVLVAVTAAEAAVVVVVVLVVAFVVTFIFAFAAVAAVGVVVVGIVIIMTSLTQPSGMVLAGVCLKHKIAWTLGS